MENPNDQKTSIAFYFLMAALVLGALGLLVSLLL